ncbi:hypothetical protein ASD26_09420 [Streptomyces sp. Root1319]|nr:hypothetical protein ASD26_09420 [Streptomyces sp. Root1319]
MLLVRVRGLVRKLHGRGCPTTAGAYGHDGHRAADKDGRSDAQTDPESGVAAAVGGRGSGRRLVTLLGGIGGLGRFG